MSVLSSSLINDKLRKNTLYEGKNDVNQGTMSKHLIKVLIGTVTRARVRRLKGVNLLQIIFSYYGSKSLNLFHVWHEMKKPKKKIKTSASGIGIKGCTKVQEELTKARGTQYKKLFED